ncbi:tandem-95 repeat protein, partial [Gimesia sp.]|uniref:golvesin C-terminal-like domain-containing protein n=1 Tax=Gimesia sp. TaxID=2024833 RepID=UPI003A949E05
ISYSYNVIDGNGGTVSQTATITISGVNNAPVAVADAFTTSEGFTLTSDNVLSANPTTADSDAEGQTLTVSAVAGGTVGAQFTLASGALLTLNSDGTFSYDPNGQFEYLSLGEAATDSFTYTISDPEAATDTATVTVTITGVNAAPTVGAAIGSTVNENDVAFNLNLLTGASDVDASDVLNVSGLTLVSGDTAGITVNGNTLDVDPDAYAGLYTGETEVVSYSYIVTDGNGGTVSQTATITIAGVNDVPTVSAALSSTVTENDGTYSLNLLAGAEDTDANDTLNVSGLTLVSGNAAGITVNGNTLDIDPGVYNSLAEGESEVVSYSYSVTDANGNTVAQTATISIAGVNDTPTVGAALSSTVTEEAGAYSLNLLSDAVDADTNDSLNVSGLTLVSGDAAGVTVNGNTLEIDPGAYTSLAEEESEVISYSYNVIDGNGGTVAQTATITITGLNNTPTVSAELSSSVTEDDGVFSLDLLSGASDIDLSDSLNVSGLVLVSGDATGVTVNGNMLDINPIIYTSLNTGESAVISYSYDIVDGNGGTVAQTATITITGMNDNPTVSAALSSTVTEDDGSFSLDLLAGASDADANATLNVSGLTLVSGDAAGITVNGNTLEIDPNAYNNLVQGATEVVTYSYNIIDGDGGSTAQAATITIRGVQDPGIHVIDETGELTNGSANINFGRIYFNESATRTITISNYGIDPLDLSGGISILGGNGFTLVSQPAVSSLDPGESTTFEIQFNAGATQGTFADTVTILSNDPNQGTFTFDISATVIYVNIIDNGDAGYSTTGTWGYITATWDYGSDRNYIIHTSSPGTGANTATWSFSGLAAGYYRLSGNLPTGSLYTPHAEYTISGVTGGDDFLVIDQSDTEINGYYEDYHWGETNLYGGHYFQDFGYYKVEEGGTLSVTLTDNNVQGNVIAHAGYVLADAMRLEALVDVPATIEVFEGSQVIVDDTVSKDMDAVFFGESTTKTFTILNSGASTLDLSNGVTLTGTSGFSIASQPAVTSLAAGESTTFVVQFDADFEFDFEVGSPWAEFTETVTIPNSVQPEEPFTFDINATISSEKIIDDGDSGFSTTGTWTYGTNSDYFEDDILSVSSGGTGLNTATWEFTDLNEGTYRVSGTWFTYWNRASNAKYTISGIVGGDVEVTVDQHWIVNFIKDEGAQWQDFGYFEVESGGTLSITLTDEDANGVIGADAFRIGRVPAVIPEIGVYDSDSELENGASTVDFGIVHLGETVTRTITINNTGTNTLDLSNGISVAGGSGFVITSQPVSALFAGQSTTFEIAFTAGTEADDLSDTVTILSNDYFEELFTFDLTATANYLKIIDNEDPGYSTTGSWLESTHASNYLGSSDYLNGGGTGLNTATWQFDNPVAGTYRVSSNWFTYGDRATNIEITIDGVSGGPVTQYLNQRTLTANLAENGVNWEDFGYFDVDGSGPITVTISDNLANGKVIADAVRVELINTTPKLDTISDPTAIDEDAGEQTVNLTGISAGGGESQTLTVTAVSSNPSLIADPTVVYTSGQSTGTLTYTPLENQSGTAVVTVTVTDEDGGQAVQTFTVSVNGVNDDPTLDVISDPAVIAINATGQTVNLSGITAGGGETQTLTVTASSSNTSVIPDPVVNYTSADSTGTLTYSPVTDAYGSAVITVTVSDGQGGETTKTFTVVVNGVNVDLQLDPISDPTVIDEDAGEQTVSLTGITAGAGKQVVSLIAISDNPSLISDPSVTYTPGDATGSLSYTPTGNASGSAQITVIITDEDGVTYSDIFTVGVNAVNDLPTLDAITDPTAINGDASEQMVNLTGISAGGGESQTLTVTAVSSNPSLIADPTVSYTSGESTGTLVYAPLANQSGTAVITVTETDEAGGQTVQNFSISVVAVPTIVISDASVSEDGSFMEFLVTLDQSAAGPVSVDFATLDGTATVAGNDYIAETGTLDFAGNAGETKSIVVTINDDYHDVTDEDFYVNLSNVQTSGAYVILADAQGKGTIVDDDRVVMILDNGDLFDQTTFTGFRLENNGILNASAVGNQIGYGTSLLNYGYQNDLDIVHVGTGLTAYWEFSGLDAGEYRISVTWPDNAPISGLEIPTTATYYVLDDYIQVDSPVVLNQRETPSSFYDDGALWEDLGIYSLSSGSLTVMLPPTINSRNLVDAVRIERISSGADIDVRDITDEVVGETPYTLVVDENQAGVDFGTTELLTEVTRSFQIANQGTDPLNISNITISPEFSTDLVAQTVAAGETIEFTVTMNAATFGDRDGLLTFDTNDSNETNYEIRLQGNVSNVVVIDNGDSDFSVTEGFVVFDTNYWQGSAGFGGDISAAIPNQPGNTPQPGAETATWTFSGLTDGDYRVSTTWSTGYTRVDDAPFTLDGGADTFSIDVNQQIAPAGFTDLGKNWLDLNSLFTVTGGVLTVTLTNDANSYWRDNWGPGYGVIADAIRIEYLPETELEISVVNADGSEEVLQDDAGIVDFGATLPDVPVVKDFVIRNLSTQAVDVAGLINLPPQFTIVPGSEIGLSGGSTVLAGGDSVTFSVQFNPEGSLGEFTGQLFVTSGDPDNSPYNITLKAESGPLTVNYDDPEFIERGRWLHDAVHDLPYLYSSTQSQGIGDGTKTVTWEFDVTPGTYQIAANWVGNPNIAPYNSGVAPDAHYTVYDDTTPLTDFHLDQVNGARGANDFYDDLQGWDFLGTPVEITGNKLRVVIADDGHGLSLADSLRIYQVDADFEYRKRPVIAGSISVNEGATYTLDLPVVDADGAAFTEWTIHWGDGDVETISGAPASVSHIFPDGDQTVMISAAGTSANGTISATPRLVTVQNVAPALTISGNDYFIEGASYTLNLSESDPGDDTIVEWTIDWGDGSVETIVGNPTSAVHVFNNMAASHTVSATATDEDGTFNSNSIVITALNEDPVLTISGSATTNEGSLYSLDLSAVDTDTGTISNWSISWGDGIVETIFGNPTTVTHLYTDGAASRTISATATDEYGTYDANSIVVNVLNVAPTLIISGSATVDEGATYTLSLSESDPGIDTITQWSVDWGDGNVETIAGNPSSATHVYLDDSPSYTISATATDEDGTFNSNSIVISVLNVDPVLTISGNATVDEAAIYTLSLASSDSGTDTITEWSIDWGDGNVETIAGNPSAATHVFADGSDSFTVSATATNEDGTYNSNSIVITVLNVAPTLTISGDATVDEGATYTLNLSSSDPGADTVTEWLIDWGDGNVETIAGNPSSASHIFADGADSYTVSATATDEDSTFNSNSIVVSVLDVAPTLTISGNATVDEGATYTLNLSASDPGADTITEWSIDWGDGNVETVVGNPSSVTHVFADGADSHTVSATATDEDGTFNSNLIVVSVLNVAPTLTISGDATINEGATYTL